MIVSKYTLVLILSLITVFTVQAQRQPSAPAFIVGGFKDMESISTGMPKLYLKFKVVNVPAELHIYADVGHGFGGSKETKGPHSKWLEPLIARMFDINKIGDDL